MNYATLKDKLMKLVRFQIIWHKPDAPNKGHNAQKSEEFYPTVWIPLDLYICEVTFGLVLHPSNFCMPKKVLCKYK